jgi:hypothetical protein
MDARSLEFDEVRGVLFGRVDAGLSAQDFEKACDQMRSAVAVARCHGPLLFLNDSRCTDVFGQSRAEVLWRIITAGADPFDRIAILVDNSVAKMRCRDQVGDRAMTFASENAAYTWLCAGKSVTGYRPRYG